MSHQTRTIQFDEFIFETIELLYEFAPFKEVFTLIALINNILNSSEIYIRHFAVALKENSNYPLSYKEASNKHALFKCIKTNDPKAKLSDFICYPKIGKFYQIELSFNKNFSLFSIMDSFD
jgi:hypothetical protein